MSFILSCILAIATRVAVINQSCFSSSHPSRTACLCDGKSCILPDLPRVLRKLQMDYQSLTLGQISTPLSFCWGCYCE